MHGAKNHLIVNDIFLVSRSELLGPNISAASPELEVGGSEGAFLYAPPHMIVPFLGQTSSYVRS